MRRSDGASVAVNTNAWVTVGDFEVSEQSRIIPVGDANGAIFYWALICGSSGPALTLRVEKGVGTLILSGDSGTEYLIERAL